MQAMVGFGRKQAWLAVLDGDPAGVEEALGLRDLGPVPWREGTDLSYLTDDRVLLTPPLRGAGAGHWVLVAGRWLMRPHARPDVAALSAMLDTEVQFFTTYRVTELHRWERASNGVLTRAFEYLGETGEVTNWYGDPDPVERSLGLPPTLAGDASILVDEADVLRVAAAWSVDPTTLDGRPAAGPLRASAAQSGQQVNA